MIPHARDLKLSSLLDLVNNREYVAHIKYPQTGFFTKPFVPEAGPFQGKLIKIYKTTRNKALAQRLKSLHDDYVAQLSHLDINIPETEMAVLFDRYEYCPVIIQYAFPQASLVRRIIQTKELLDCIELLKGILLAICRFWLSLNGRAPDNRLGLAASLRNCAFFDKHFWFFDTFPPLTSISNSEIHSLMLEFAPYSICRIVRPLISPMLHHVTSEYYDIEKMLKGIVGSACRLRPEFVSQFLEISRRTMTNQSIIQLNNYFIAQLDYPPRLSKTWLLTRFLLAQKGAPNVKRIHRAKHDATRN